MDTHEEKMTADVVQENEEDKENKENKEDKEYTQEKQETQTGEDETAQSIPRSPAACLSSNRELSARVGKIFPEQKKILSYGHSHCIVLSQRLHRCFRSACLLYLFSVCGGSFVGLWRAARKARL